MLLEYKLIHYFIKKIMEKKVTNFFDRFFFFSYTNDNLYQLNLIHKKDEDIPFHGRSLVVNKFKSEVNILIANHLK